MELGRGNTEHSFASLQRRFTGVGEQRDARQVPEVSFPGLRRLLPFLWSRSGPALWKHSAASLLLVPADPAAGSSFDGRRARLFNFFFGGGILVSQVAVGERAGVHCEPQLKSLAPGSFSKARSLEIGAKAGDFGLGIVRWGVELSRRPLSS